MLSALVAAAIIGILVVAVAKPLWLGLVVTNAMAYIPFPVHLQVSVAAVSLQTWYLHGIRVILQQWMLLSVERVAFQAWPLRVSIFNVRVRLNLSEDTPKRRYNPPLPRFLKPLLPYGLACGMKMLSILQLEIHSIELQILPTFVICDGQHSQSVSIHQICFKNGNNVSVCSLYCRAFNSSVYCRKLQADLSLPLHVDKKSLTVSVSGVELDIIRRIKIALSSVDVNVKNVAIEMVVHIVTATANEDPFLFLGEFCMGLPLCNGLPLQNLTPSVSVFGVKIHLDPVVGAISALQPYLNAAPAVTIPQQQLEFSFYSIDIQVTAIHQSLVLAYIEELEVLCSPDYAIHCRNIHSGLNGHDILRVSSFALKPHVPKLVLEAGNITINAHLELVKIIFPVTKLAFDFVKVVPKQTSAPAPLDLELTTRAVLVSLPRMFDVMIKTAQVTVDPHQQFSLRMFEPELIYDSARFLSLSVCAVTGQQATSTCPHPTIDVSGDAIRGHWSPPMQYDLLYLVKEIIAAVIRCKRDLYPVVFRPSDQLPTSRPTEVARGLPTGESPFYDWAFRDRAPYLVDKLQIVSLHLSDILLTAAMDDSVKLTCFAERFSSEFLPWEWHLSRVAVCLDSFPLFHLLSLDISRDCHCPDVTLSDLKCDPLLTEQTVKLLLYSPIRISAASISARVPSYDSYFYNTIDPLSILHQTRGLIEALGSIPSLDALARQHDGPGYEYPPDFRLQPVVNFHCRHLTVFLVDTSWDSWIHHVRPVGLDERLGSDSRRELLRLKIREHQRRTGHLLSDAKITLMSSRLAESNFELFRNRIVRLKATHGERWSFPPLQCVSEEFRPGDLRLGALLSVSISEIACKARVAPFSGDQLPNENLIVSASCSLQTESLEVSLRQFSPSVIDISRFHCVTDISIYQDTFGPKRSCNMNLSPRHRVSFSQPLYPPFVSIGVHCVEVIHPCITFSPSLLPTLKDLTALCYKLRPSFIDPAIRSLSPVDIVRYVVEIRRLDSALVSNFSLRMLQEMAFCTSTESPSHPSLLIKGTDCKAFLNLQSNSLHIAVDEVTFALNDGREDSRTKVHMSHESVHKQEPSSDDQELYETGILLKCFKIDSSANVDFISAGGLPCATRCLDKPTPDVDDHSIDEDPFELFRTARIAVVMNLAVGSLKHQTKVTLNTQNLPLLLPICCRIPAISIPDITSIQFSCSQLSVSNCSFALLDASNSDDPGQGLRFQVADIRSRFDLDGCAIHNLYISLSGLNASLIANEAFWRKCESGHELAHEIRNGTVVVVHTYENQRFILGQGWLSRLLPTDRPSWSDIDGTQELRRDSPLFDLPSEHWQWESDWVIDRGQLCGKGKVDPDGWEYAHDFPRTYTFKRHWTDNVRRRRWFRVRRLIDSVDKTVRTNHEEQRNRRQNGLLFLVDSCQMAQKSCSTLIIRSASPLQSPSIKSVSESPEILTPVTRVISLLTFFSIGSQPSPSTCLSRGIDNPSPSPNKPSTSEKVDDSLSSSPYLFSVKIVSPRARMTLESRNALVQLFRSYMLHFEYYFRLRSAPKTDNDNIADDKSEDLVFSADENSDDDEVDPNESILSNQAEDENAELISQTPALIADNPDSDSINPVALLDIVSIEVQNAQVAVESPVESACGIVLACMHSCLITARSFDADGLSQESERVDIRLLVDNLTIRLAPTDIDVEAKPMWFDFQACASESVMKAVVDPFPIQASAMFYPFSSSSHNVFLLLPMVNVTLDRLQCALLEAILSRVLIAELPLPPLQSATEFVHFSVAGLSAFDGRITNHQRILWQIRHLEWLMGVYNASDPIDETEGKSDAGELALLSAHLSSLRQQFVDSIMSVSVDLHTHLSGIFFTNPLDFHFRLEAFTLSLVFVNRIEFMRITVAACSGLVEVQFKGEGSLQVGFEIRDVRVIDTRNEMPDWQSVLVPAYLCGSNGQAVNGPDQNAENRAVLTLQCTVKRVGGIVVICSCVLNLAHFVTRITQTLIDDLVAFASRQTTSKTERKARIVPKVSGVLAQADHPRTLSPSPEQPPEGICPDESTPAHLRDLRLYCERSQNSIIITYLRIGAVRATISFKGGGSSGMADFQGVSVRLPAMIYQKKTWTLEKFARRLRRDFIKAALRQAGPGLASIIKYKFGGLSTDMGSFSFGSHEELNALDIDLPVGSIPIQPSPHPISKGKAGVSDIINKFKTGASDAATTGQNPAAPDDQADEVKDPNKRYLLFGKQSNP